MKKILITGANSYVGTSFEKWLSKWPDKYHVDTIDMKERSWRAKSFKDYDVVFHVAGIAHRKETKENAHEYYEVNRDLAVETARKAKNEGVAQFILMSTMGVYGMLTGVIKKDTVLNPKTHYGKSKLQAEEQVQKLSDDNFRVVILRPPMIYGRNCMGNYQKLAKLARVTLVFPDIKNKRSMIYIDNLSEFIRDVIDKQSRGIYCPQNGEYVCTSHLVREIANCHGHKIYMTRLFSSVLELMICHNSQISKVFGNLCYLEILTCCNPINFKKSIELTEMPEGKHK